MTIDRDEALADLGATVDYLAGLRDAADQMGFEDATDIRDEAERVKKMAGDLVSFLEGAMMTHLEAGSREYGGRVWVRKRQFVDRHDHAALLGAVRDAAIRDAYDSGSGEVNPDKAMGRMLDWFRTLYLSPSTKAKVTVARDELGLDTKTFVSREDKGWKLDVVDLRNEDPE